MQTRFGLRKTKPGRSLSRSLYSPAVFVVVSDDPAWCEANLADSANGVFVQNEAASSSFDFALLASCDHVIMSRGSFGLWAAVMAGGRIRMEAGFLDGTPYAND